MKLANIKRESTDNRIILRTNIKDFSYEQKIHQILTDLNTFMENHIHDALPTLLRQKLRFLHKNLETGEAKKQVRGLLIYMSRWDNLKTWLRVTNLFKLLTVQHKFDSLTARKAIMSNRYVSPLQIFERA